MYRGYNLSLNEEDLKHVGREARSSYKENLNKNRLAIRNKIEALVDASVSIDNYKTADGNALDGSKLIKEWFPVIEADVFISHSHQDEDLAINLGAWLYQMFGLKSFIDSTVWGYSNNLLKALDNKYCYMPQTNSYNYETRNLTTGHVHMMLSTALNNMINKTECLFFLNTPNSITIGEDIEKMNTSTYSPWIFSELSTAMIVEKKHPRREREMKQSLYKMEANLEKRERLLIEYQTELSRLTKIDKLDLLSWSVGVSHHRIVGSSSLDVLYSKTLKEEFSSLNGN